MKKKKNIIIALLICLCILLCNLTFMVLRAFATDDSSTNLYEWYGAVDNEPYGTSIGYPFYGGFFKITDNSPIKGQWCDYIHTNSDGSKWRQWFMFYLSDNINDFNFTIYGYGNHNRRGSSFSISDVKKFSNFYYKTETVNTSMAKSLEIGGKTFYYYISTVSNVLDCSHAVEFSRCEQNFNFRYFINNVNNDRDFEGALLKAIKGEDLLDLTIDGNGNLLDNKPITCPSDAAFDALLYFDDFYKSKDVDYRSIGSEVSFYPDEVLGKSITLNYTYDTNTYVYRDISALELLKHPTYGNGSKRYPKIKLTYTTSLIYDIPSSIEELQDISNLSPDSDIYVKSGIYYNSKSHKIVIRHFMKHKEYKEIIHNLVKNYELKIGKAKCKDCSGHGIQYVNKYKHIGKPFQVSLNAQLSQNNVKSKVFSFKAEYFSKSQGGSYYNPDNDTTLDKNHNDNLIFNGTDKDGTKNDYLSDERYDQAMDDNKIEDMEFKDAVSWLKSLTKSLKDFPEFFADYFAFIPWASTYAQLVMCLLIVGVVVGFLKLLLS